MGVAQRVAQNIKIAVLISLSVTLYAASAHEDTSPVQVFDIPKWIELSKRANASPKVMSVKRLIEVIYDRIISRPYETEEKYWLEAGKRWANFRVSYCPSKLTLCSLSDKLENMQQLEAIRNGLVDSANRDLINKDLNKEGLQLSPNLIFPVQLAATDSDKTNFSFRIATIEKEEASDVQDKSLITMGDVIMNDIFTYRMAYNREIARTYFALDSDGNGYIQADRIREATVTMAKIWKRSVEREVNFSYIDIQDLLLQSLRKELQREFEATYIRLLAKLDPNNPEHVEHIERFKEELAKGRLPTEVYQWVFYDQLTRVAEVLTQHYQQAKVDYQDLHTPNLALKGVVALEQQVSHRLLFYLLQRVWDYDEGSVIEQIVPKPLAGMYMVEHLHVLLENESYKDLEQFEKLSSKIDYGLLTAEAELLKEQHPDFYNRMTSMDLFNAEKLQLAPAAIRKQWMKELVLKNGEPFKIGIYRLSAALTLGLDARTARDAAEIIRKVRLNKQDNES